MSTQLFQKVIEQPFIFIVSQEYIILVKIKIIEKIVKMISMKEIV